MPGISFCHQEWKSKLLTRKILQGKKYNRENIRRNTMKKENLEKRHQKSQLYATDSV